MIDADSHVMEPDDLFDRYLDPAFKLFAPKTRRIATDWPYFADMDVLGHRWPATLNWEDIRYLDDGRTFMDAYAEFLALEWSPAAYVLYMDQAGIDAMVVYPTLTLHSTAVPNIDPEGRGRGAARVQRLARRLLRRR